MDESQHSAKEQIQTEKNDPKVIEEQVLRSIP